MIGGGVAASAAFGTLLAACGGGDDGGSSAGQGTTGMTDTDGGSTGSASTGGSSSQDLEILNYALTLEYLEADFYSKVGEGGLFEGGQVSLLQTFGEHEQQHVAALTRTITDLGGTPTKQPQAQFPLESATAVAKLAATVENLGAAAEILAAAGSIVQMEGRHVGAIRLKNQAQPAPEAFDTTLGMDEVVSAVKPLIES